MKFILSDDWKSEDGNLNSIPTTVLLLILKQLPPRSFFALRLATKKFRELADDGSFIWEPPVVNLATARTFEFNLGNPRAEVGGNYYLSGQLGEYRWPAGELLLCREKDNAIEIKTLASKCEFKEELVAHKAKISVLKPLSKNRFASGDKSGCVFIWRKTEAGFQKTQLTSEMHKHSAEISAIAKVNDNQIFTADTNGNLKCWDLSSHAYRGEKDFSHPVISLKALLEDELEVVTKDIEKERFHVSILSSKDGEQIRNEADLKIGFNFARYKLPHFGSFFNGNKTEFRVGVLRSNVFLHTHLANGMCFNLDFPPSKQIKDFPQNNAGVFSNGNILFWSNNGSAKLVFHKRLPFTHGKDSSQPAEPLFHKRLRLAHGKDSPQPEQPPVIVETDNADVAHEVEEGLHF